MLNKIHRSFAVVFAITLSAVIGFTGPVLAAGFPDKPITLLVGSRVGGSTDISARIFAKFLEKEIDQKIIVVNKPGAGGIKAALLMKGGDADGYTLMYTYSTSLTFTPIYKRDKEPFSLNDFSYLGALSSPHYGLPILSDKPYKDLDSMMAHFKKNGETVRYTYAGGAGLLIGQAISKKYGVKFKAVRVGGSKAMAQLLGGHFDLAYTGGAHISHVKAGNMISVATSAATRYSDDPGTKTLMEQGINVSTPVAQMVVAKKGMPKDVHDKLAKSVLAVANNKEFQDFLIKKLQFNIIVRDAAGQTKEVMKERESYRNLISNSGS